MVKAMVVVKRWYGPEVEMEVSLRGSLIEMVCCTACYDDAPMSWGKNQRDSHVSYFVGISDDAFENIRVATEAVPYCLPCVQGLVSIQPFYNSRLFYT